MLKGAKSGLKHCTCWRLGSAVLCCLQPLAPGRQTTCHPSAGTDVCYFRSRFDSRPLRVRSTAVHRRLPAPCGDTSGRPRVYRLPGRTWPTVDVLPISRDRRLLLPEPFRQPSSAGPVDGRSSTPTRAVQRHFRSTTRLPPGACPRRTWSTADVPPVSRGRSTAVYASVHQLLADGYALRPAIAPLGRASVIFRLPECGPSRQLTCARSTADGLQRRNRPIAVAGASWSPVGHRRLHALYNDYYDRPNTTACTCSDLFDCRHLLYRYVRLFRSW